MARNSFLLLLALGSVQGCGSSSSDSPGSSGGTNAGACPSLAGTWKVTMHCDQSLVGQSAVVTQSNCSLAFAPPFDGFSGAVTANDEVTLSGPQSCSGSATGSPVSLMSLACTPGTCAVSLSKTGG